MAIGKWFTHSMFYSYTFCHVSQDFAEFFIKNKGQCTDKQCRPIITAYNLEGSIENGIIFHNWYNWSYS